MKVTSLWRYPIKSCRGTSHNSLEVSGEGFKGDRRYQWVTDRGRFVTQREFPALSQISAEYHDEQLVCVLNNKPHQLDSSQFTAKTKVTIWNDQVEANLYTGELNKIVSKFLGFAVRLVQMPVAGRAINPDFAQGHVSFADGLPYLLTNEFSLADLNGRLAKPVSMLNFRPNIVVDGNQAFEEDDWRQITIGSVTFKNVKPCTRCVLTTIDPETGTKAPDAEPLKTLASYRQPEPGQILFGINLVAEGTGQIRVGDKVVIE